MNLLVSILTGLLNLARKLLILPERLDKLEAKLDGVAEKQAEIKGSVETLVLLLTNHLGLGKPPS